MGLKSATAGSGVVGKFTGQPLTAVSSQFSSPPSPPSVPPLIPFGMMFIPQ